MESLDIKKPTFWELNKDRLLSELKGITTPNTKKYIITVDKSIQSTNGKTITLNKGDVIQGIEISSYGNMANDSGSQSMTFEDKNGNRFSVGVGYRGFQPFFEENKSIFYTLGLPMVTCPDGTKDIANGIMAPCMGQYGNNKPTEKQLEEEEQRRRYAVMQQLTKEAQANQNQQRPRTFYEMNKGYIFIGLALVAGYFAYKKFKN
jgi:hypothetical protein